MIVTVAAPISFSPAPLRPSTPLVTLPDSAPVLARAAVPSDVSVPLPVQTVPQAVSEDPTLIQLPPPPDVTLVRVTPIEVGVGAGGRGGEEGGGLGAGAVESAASVTAAEAHVSAARVSDLHVAASGGAVPVDAWQRGGVAEWESALNDLF